MSANNKYTKSEYYKNLKANSQNVEFGSHFDSSNLDFNPYFGGLKTRKLVEIGEQMLTNQTEKSK